MPHEMVGRGLIPVLEPRQELGKVVSVSAQAGGVLLLSVPVPPEPCCAEPRLP